MPTYASGSRKARAFVAETTYGSIPASPSMKALRCVDGVNFDMKRDALTSKENSPTRQVLGMGLGNKNGSFSIPVEFSYGSFDDLLEAVLGGTWTTNVLKLGTANRSFVFEDGSPDVNVYELATGCVLTGLELDVKSNSIVSGSFSGVFKDLRVAQTVGASLAFDSTAKTITRSTGSFIADGFAVGDKIVITGAADAGNNLSGAVISALTATVMTCSSATGMVTKTTAVGATIGLSSLGTAATVSSATPFDSFTGAILEGGVAIAYVLGIKLNLAITNTPNFALMDPTVQNVTTGLMELKGSMSVYFVDESLKKKFLNGVSTSLQFTLGSGSATSYTFNMGTVKYTSNGRDTAAGSITESIEFQAFYDTTDASTLKITRIP